MRSTVLFSPKSTLFLILGAPWTLPFSYHQPPAEGVAGLTLITDPSEKKTVKTLKHDSPNVTVDMKLCKTRGSDRNGRAWSPRHVLVPTWSWSTHLQLRSLTRPKRRTWLTTRRTMEPQLCLNLRIFLEVLYLAQTESLGAAVWTSLVSFRVTVIRFRATRRTDEVSNRDFK